MPRPVHFEIHGSDPEALKTFYETVFGWTFSKWGEMPYWLVTTGDGNPMEGKPHSEPGIDGGLLPRQGAAPGEGAAVNSFVITMEVPDCQQYADKAVAAGGSIAMPVDAVPGIGYLAYVKDPDGNIFGLMQSDPAAGSAES